jgi:hypothetical protein
MSDATRFDWYGANQRSLASRLEYLARRLDGSGDDEPERAAPSTSALLSEPAALDRLVEAFELSPFECDVLLLVAGMELDAGFAERCAACGIESQVSFSTAFSRLTDAHWSAMSPAGPLRRWRLLELSEPDNPTRAVLRIDERVLHFLMGISYVDPRLQPFLRKVEPPEELPNSHREAVDRLVALLSPDGEDAVPLVHLCGKSPAAARAIAASACDSCGLELHAMRAGDIPAAGAERAAVSRLWEREAALTDSALLIEIGESDQEAPVESFLENTRGVILVAGSRVPRLERRVLRCEFSPPTFNERAAGWEAALGSVAWRINGGVGRIAAQFRMDADAVRDVAAETARLAPTASLPEIEQHIWRSCRNRSRGGLDRLAQYIEPRAGWHQLVLPEESVSALRSIAAHVRQQARVYEEWGFARQSGRGLGVSALFTGPSGTGKTLAAEVIANDLALDLYRIDLSQVVSKYIGETEKNLRAVFDAAEEGGAVLLFDEADALFGKRSDVKDSHDRYANIEVSYLLQRMEDYRGLAILTTNQKDALDKAFLRRIRFVVTFLFPDVQQRAEIWRRIFPPETPTDRLDPEKLARLNVTGGNIRNIAVCGAFLAAEANEPVRMRHLLEAARTECAKLDKPLTQAEVGGWI